MIHPANFVDANQRHWKDAELLFDHQRWANADQLYGLSAECGLKAVMQILGMPVDDQGRPSKRYRKHVHEIWPDFVTFAGERKGARYLSRLPADAPFDDWSHHNRYAAHGHFQPGDVEQHRDAARRVFRVVQLAMQSGQP